jgi:3-hydroxyisobutyrate dehydrogenase-like beta-hydroxyacid dehydrogenase
MMLAGPDEVFEKCRGVLEAISKRRYRFGDRAGDA